MRLEAGPGRVDWLSKTAGERCADQGPSGTRTVAVTFDAVDDSPPGGGLCSEAPRLDHCTLRTGKRRAQSLATATDP